MESTNLVVPELSFVRYFYIISSIEPDDMDRLQYLAVLASGLVGGCTVFRTDSTPTPEDIPTDTLPAIPTDTPT